MTVSTAKNVFLALLLTFTTATYAARCAEPRVRREWRSIPEAEREEWISAVKVGCDAAKESTWWSLSAEPFVVSQKGASQAGVDADLRRVGHSNPIY